MLYTRHLITSGSECYLSIWLAQHNLTSCLPFVSFMLFGILNCKALSTYLMHILLSSIYTDKGSGKGYNLTRCCPLVGLYRYISTTRSSLPIQPEWIYPEHTQYNTISRFLEREQVIFFWISRSWELIEKIVWNV